MLMRQILANAAWATPGAVAVRDGATALSFSELDDRVHRLASEFHARGYDTGERVALMAENSFRYFEWYFACCESGAVAVTVNVRWTATEIAAYLLTIEPAVLIADVRLESLVTEVLAAVPLIATVYWFDSEAPAGRRLAVVPGQGLATGFDYETAMDGAEPVQLRPSDPDAPSIIASTSGTTGTYRGAVISQRATWTAGLGWTARFGFTRTDRIVIPLPLYFAGGSPNWTLAFFSGAETIVMRKYNIDAFLAVVRQHAATFAMLVPAMIYDLADRDPAEVAGSIATLRLIGTGGAPISADRLGRAVDALGPRFMVAYGLTEACASGTALFPADYRSPAGYDLQKLRSVGRPYPSVTMRVLDANGAEVPHDGQTAGEIVFYGPSVASGYFRRTDDGGTFRDGGVFTGDLGVVYADGSLRIVDRRKDLIISGGINVVPREVEEVISADPRVATAAVVGVPHERLGECVCAFVVPAAGAVLAEADVLDWCRSRIAAFKRPKLVFLVERLPVNSTGKLLKRDLIELASRTIGRAQA
jgi:acyl-CoA synthetase (AMP-forming)/AMP-acid ligase II